LHTAIVGSGPSGFYAAEALLRSDHVVRVSMFDRLPTPFGLVRGGVAPDHPKIKQASLVYDKIARSPAFTFFGNVTVGRDITVDELCARYHAVVFACGASVDRRLNVGGEKLPGSHAATDFVGWYNGHPDYRDCTFDFSHTVAVIIGQGNVAADVCRMLTTPIDALRQTDIAEHALEILAESRIREVHIIGRRGPAQAKFTNAELRELGKIPGCAPIVDAQDLVLNAESEIELRDVHNQVAIKNLEIFRAFAARSADGARRRIRFRFLESPIEIVGDDCVRAVKLVKNRLQGEPFQQVALATDDQVEIPCGLIFRSIGYRGVPMPGVPFDERRGVIPNRDGRILNVREPLAGLYATGWIKRGPTGIIGSNRADSVATVKSLLEDVPILDPSAKLGADAARALLEARSVRIVNYDDWLRIDRAEVARGEPKGKPREKFIRIEDMLGVLS
jgi:ferredoxin--NADP+ reductase